DTRIEVNDSTRTRGVAAGIRKLELLVQSNGDEVQARLDWDTERAGVIQGRAQTRLARQAGGWTLPDDAPLGGQVRAQLQDLGVWGSLAPLGWRITGALDADVKLAGTVQAPQLQGPIRVDGLNLRSVLDGVDLHDGRLRARLNGHRLDIEELVLQGGTGSHAYVRGMSGNRTQAPTERGRMVANGRIDWSGVAHATAQNSGIALDANARLERMQVLVRNDRQVSVSGELSAGLADGRLRVRGDVHVDRASITLPDSGAPTLGDDVVVVRASDRQAEAKQDEAQARGELQTAQPMDMEVKLDLGRDFALQGYGITTRLQGELTIRSVKSGNDPIAIVGEIRTDEGRFRAWGQALNVETGIVMFNGPYSNPSLDLLAVRPNIDVRAGVRVTGTALAPRVALYSEPQLPDAETLSWVVLGRAPGTGGGGDGNAMQRAALGLLAGNLTEGLGFDEVGVSESGVAIGKRLSDQLYVTYEAGMSGAASTLYMFYDITRRLTARGQTGKTSAVDLIYTITYD
ncbi:MAG TPA: translocation/assembly module TamB domain-containing protein, partial [Burkholderiaceae bacterium]|nr:translocation/assembly module TamB domain-containing protein [Burkholderiaceae bacterium]